MFDWQDLQFFLALSRSGSLSAAARDLGVDHATVGRRVSSLETALNLKLVDRLPRHCPLTDNGRLISALAEDVDGLAHEIKRLAKGAATSLSGTVRISVPPALSACCIAPQLASLRQRYPELKITLLSSPDFADVGRGEADIALRLSQPKEADAITRKVAAIGFAAYATPEYMARPAYSWEFIAFDSGMDQAPQQQWLQGILKGRSIALEASDLFAQEVAAQAGAGVAVLPTIVGDKNPALSRVETDVPPPIRDLWIITYPDLRRSPLIRVTMDFLIECFRGKSS
ncbi:LysR family transcriptional regulator [Pseudovibrio axinellae]|nr:LysR family transcriptional regulator [Pseudovibrio axinellae]